MHCDISLATKVAARLSLYKFPDVAFFAQGFNIPGIRSVYPKVQTPRIITAMPPQSIVYDPLVVTIILREDLSNHRTLLEWMQASILEKSDEVFSDGSAFILDTQRQPVSEIKFIGMFPDSISNIEYITTADTTIYQTVTATFNYLKYHYV